MLDSLERANRLPKLVPGGGVSNAATKALSGNSHGVNVEQETEYGRSMLSRGAVVIG